MTLNNFKLYRIHQLMLRWQGNFFKCVGLISAGMMFKIMPIFSQSPPTLNTPETLDLDPEIIENSPVLQRWNRQIPNVLEQIKEEPSFRTRVRLGYSQYPANDDVSGWNIVVEDVFLGKTGLTLSADYQSSFNGNQTASGATLQYYVRPLGSYVNFAPVVGYRHLNSEDYTAGGLNVGGKIMVALSRGGAADLSLTQTWVKPATENEVGITTLSVGYAISDRFRLSTDIQKQNAPESKESRVGIVLEWMP